MFRLAALASMALVAAPAAAAGLEPVLALRLGVAGAVGSAVANLPISDTIPLQFPIQVDALARRGPLAIGAYGSWGFAHAAKCADASCSAWDARLGLQATWTFILRSGGEPWIGVASGYEWARQNRTRVGTVTTTWRGWEPIALQGGIEWPVLRWLALGPYGIAGLGRYSMVTVDTGYESATASVPDEALHAWLHLGVRGRFLLGGER
jgi:hypothetical protein